MVGPARWRHACEPADVLVLPESGHRGSERYTSPLKLFEYLALGRPIVASDLPAFREVLATARTPCSFEAGSAPALAAGDARACSAIRSSPGRWPRRAFETARDYSWDARAERLEELFSEAAGRRAW